MSNRFVVALFESYQKQRVHFIHELAEMAQSPGNIETIRALGGIQICRGLLHDAVPSIQVSAALALSRIASYNEDAADAVVTCDVLPQLVYSLAEQNRFYKKAAAAVLRAVARHSVVLAQAVVDAGALDALAASLEDFDPGVREAGAWTLGAVARHTPELAQAVVDAGAVPLLVLCAGEPEISLRRIAVAALGDIARHTPELAQAVVDAGAVPHIAALVSYADPRLQRQACTALAHIAKQSIDLAEVVVAPLSLTSLFSQQHLLRHPDAELARAAAGLIRELTKHSPELAQAVVNQGGVAALVDAAGRHRGGVRLPAVMALGYIAAFSETLALAVIGGGGVETLSRALDEEEAPHVLAAAAWALGQAGRHSAEHARAVADAGVLPKLVDLYCFEGAGPDLRSRAKHATKHIVDCCRALETLDPLLEIAPPDLLAHVVARYAAVLPENTEARKRFVRVGGLKLVLERARAVEQAAAAASETDPDTASALSAQAAKLGESVAAVSACFSDDVVRFYSPDREEIVAAMVE